MASHRTAGTAVLAFAILSLGWTVVEALPPLWGYEDTDNPAVMVGFIRDHPSVYRVSGTLLILAAGTLTVAVLTVTDVLRGEDGRGSLTVRASGVLGLIAAGCFLPLAGLRIATGSTLLLVDGLSTDWSEAAYLAVQMVGTQGLAAAAIVCLCSWAVGLCLHGIRTGALPTWLCVLGVLPAFRILTGLLAPLGTESSALWLLAMLAIPGTTLWFLLLGVVLLRRPWRTVTANR